MVSKVGNKYKLKGTETRSDIVDKIGGAGGGSSRKWKEGIEKLKIKNADRVGSPTTKKLTKLFDEAMNPKHKPYSKLNRKARMDLKNRGITSTHWDG